WQARRFWEHADNELNAGGELLTLHDTYRAATVTADTATTTRQVDTKTETAARSPSTVALAVSAPVTCVTITWANGEATSVHPPEIPARPADATPPTGRTGNTPVRRGQSESPVNDNA